MVLSGIKPTDTLNIAETCRPDWNSEDKRPENGVALWLEDQMDIHRGQNSSPTITTVFEPRRSVSVHDLSSLFEKILRLGV